MRLLFWLMFAGALGTLARYGLTLGIQKHLGAREIDFPLATLFINVVGCFVLAFVATLAAGKWLPGEMRIIVGTGFCGAFTTFSTFALEFDALWKRAPGAALGYGLGNLILGWLAIGLGQWIAFYVGGLHGRGSSPG